MDPNLQATLQTVAELQAANEALRKDMAHMSLAYLAMRIERLERETGQAFEELRQRLEASRVAYRELLRKMERWEHEAKPKANGASVNWPPS